MHDVFTLEVLNAFHGDCLLLHYGPPDAPHLMLIDGGPRGTWKASLELRLDALRTARSMAPLFLDHVMVSHLDSDHIAGVIDLVKDIKNDRSRFNARHFWFNTFDDADKILPPQVKVAEVQLQTGREAAVRASVEQASIAEGQSLRDAVRLLRANVNQGEQPLFCDDAPVVLDMPGLRASLISPSRKYLLKLAQKWEASTAEKAETAAYLDNSIYNLASLVVMVRPSPNGPSILLTGDARGDHILEGLEAAGLLEHGKARFSVLKVPHHGSDRTLAIDFFERLTADHYVISGDGRHDNPSRPVLEWIAQTAPENAVVWLTYLQNPGFPNVGESVAAVCAKYPGFEQRLRTIASGDLSMQIHLGSKLMD